MKKIVFVLMVFAAFSCGPAKVVSSNLLYEVIAERNTGGAQIKFYEIISEPNEFKMIKNDPALRKKVKPTDIDSANFVILSAGEKNTGGYSIGIEKVEETDKNIIITVKEEGPKPGEMVTESMTTPFTIVKINSKKEIIFNE
jgi:protease stability complex PrcB-like protein